MRLDIAIRIPLAVLSFQFAVGAQETEKYVTRNEYEKLRKELEAIKSAPQAKEIPEAQEEQGVFDSLEKELKALRDGFNTLKPGTTSFLLTGFGFVGFMDREGEDATFNAGFSPIFLWRVHPQVLFEGEIELEIEDGDLEVGLEYSQISYVINDYVTVGAGLFLAPFGTWPERFHPAWINKLPDEPLPFGHEGIAPNSLLGLQVRGGIPLGPMKMNYAAYVANGPSLVTDDADEAGTLDFGASTDVNNGKAVGGRVGFLPLPEVELGYSILAARVDPSDSDVGKVDAILHSVDLTFYEDFDLLKGAVELRSQWVWSEVDDATYDPAGANGFGPLTINDNRRNGEYVQLAYRPTKFESSVLKSLEFIGRFDALDLPRDAPENFDERRWTLGIDYWVTPSTVVKAAYQFDDKDDPEGDEKDQDAVLLQLAMGF